MKVGLVMTLAVLATLVAGCHGRYTPLPAGIVNATNPASAFAPDIPGSSGSSVALMVVDARPYVIDGRRSRNFEGVIRSRLTIVHPKDTATNQSLAEYITDGLVSGFQKANSSVERLEATPGAAESSVTDQCMRAGKDACVVLVLNEWQYEFFSHKLNFRYDTSVRVIDRNGKTAAAKSFQSFVPLPEVTVEREYLNILHAGYKKALDEMFNDPLIAQTLKGN
jgi:hypothetical protein